MSAVEAARGYLVDHPGEITRAIRNAFGLRVGVPLAALRWFGRQAEKAGKVEGPQDRRGAAGRSRLCHPRLDEHAHSRRRSDFHRSGGVR